MLARTKIILIAVVFLSATTLSIKLDQEKHRKLAGSLDNLRQAQLKKHNEYRKMHGVGPLKLHKYLNDYAQYWAEQQVQKGRMQHTQGGDYGENIYWAWSSDARNYANGAATTAWYNEVNDYDFNTGRSKNGKVVGHFTQLVWKASQWVGFGIASNGGEDYVVAEYYPPGNFNRDQKNNVFRKN